MVCIISTGSSVSQHLHIVIYMEIARLVYNSVDIDYIELKLLTQYQSLVIYLVNTHITRARTFFGFCINTFHINTILQGYPELPSWIYICML